MAAASFGGSGNLDEEIGPLCLRVELNCRLDGAGCIERQQRRYLQRHPAIEAGGCIVDWPKKIGSLPQVLDRKLEEKCLAGLSFLLFLADRVIVEVRALDRIVEDRRIRGEPGN
jgi:hypothetical protein